MSGSRVVWYEGLHPHNQTVRKVYSVESEVLQTFWCVFSEGASSSDGGSNGEGHSLRCVCVREHTCLTLFMQTGGVHYIPLPFLVSAPPLHSSTVLFYPAGTIPVPLHSLFLSSICSTPVLITHPPPPPPPPPTPLHPHMLFLPFCAFKSVHRVRRKCYVTLDEEQGQTLMTYMQDCSTSLVTIPCQVNQAWPISSGLLLERQVSPEGGSDGLPILFTLLHPMDDFCPTTFRRPTASETAISAREPTAANVRTEFVLKHML